MINKKKLHKKIFERKMEILKGFKSVHTKEYYEKLYAEHPEFDPKNQVDGVPIWLKPKEKK